MRIYSLKDLKSERFNPIQLMYTDEDAKRVINDIKTNQQQSLLSKYPEDFELYYLGEFDDVTGIVSGIESPVKICMS